MQSIKNDLTTCCFFVSDVFVLVLLRIKNKITIKMFKMKTTLCNLLSQIDSFDAPRSIEPSLLSVSIPEGEKWVSLNRQVKPALNHWLNTMTLTRCVVSTDKRR